MKKLLFFAIILSVSQLSGFTQTSSQTRTADIFNAHVSIDYWVQEGPEYISSDDDSYAYTKKITAKDNALLILQDFDFEIPGDATILNISIKVKRFKKGRGRVNDYRVYLDRSSPNSYAYGIFMEKPDLYPDTETEVIYSQNGSGTSSFGCDPVNGCPPYQWTPAMINDPGFGMWILANPPQKGTVVIYYDMVEITVNYSQPPTIAGRSEDAIEVKTAKQPIVYPNPFTTKANIQFTAAESGNAVVELYNISGVKVRTLFSGNVVEGLVYNVAVGDALLPKGIYVYKISNGKQKQTGRIMRLE